VSFFFMTVWNQALGSVGAGMLGTIQGIAFVILATMFLLSIYEAFARGGSARDLIVSLVKCAACALILQYWQQFFQDVSNGFSQLAVTIAGGVDFATAYKQSLLNIVGQNQSNVMSITGIDLAALLNNVVIFLTVLLFYIAMLLLEIMYTCWGLMLFALGPLLVALLPSNATASAAKHYLQSMAEWATWPILYAIMAKLSVSLNTLTAGTFNGGGVSGAIASGVNQLQAIVIGIIYIIFMILIPFIAHALVKGDFGGTVQGLSRLAMMVKNVAAMAATGGGSAVAGAAKSMASSARSIESSAQSMAGSATAHAGGGNGTGSTAPPPNTPAAQAPAADRGGPPASTVQNANMKSAPPGSANG
jgi:type IV secretion system protein TrbL